MTYSHSVVFYNLPCRFMPVCFFLMVKSPAIFACWDKCPPLCMQRENLMDIDLEFLQRNRISKSPEYMHLAGLGAIVDHVTHFVMGQWGDML